MTMMAGATCDDNRACDEKRFRFCAKGKCVAGLAIGSSCAEFSNSDAVCRTEGHADGVCDRVNKQAVRKIGFSVRAFKPFL